MLKRLGMSWLNLLITLGLGASASAESLTDFQVRTQVLVWDEGELDGQVDARDSFTDLTQPCNTRDDVHLESIRVRRRASAAQVMAEASAVFARLGIEAPLKSQVVSSYVAGDQRPTVFLFPELHLYPSVSPKVMRLHESRAFDMLSLAEDLLRAGHRVVNSVEGPFGVPRPKEFAEFGADPALRLRTARAVAQTKWFTGAILLAEAFPQQIAFLHNDDNDLMVRNILIDRMAVRKDAGAEFKTWSEALEYLRNRVPERLKVVRADDYRAVMEQASTWSAERLYRESFTLCERRSGVMATNTLNAMATYHADVALVSVGALHAHGVMRALEAARVNYLVFSPNF